MERTNVAHYKTVKSENLADDKPYNNMTYFEKGLLGSLWPLRSLFKAKTIVKGD